jgi:hypothetical protein
MHGHLLLNRLLNLHQTNYQKMTNFTEQRGESSHLVRSVKESDRNENPDHQ